MVPYHFYFLARSTTSRQGRIVSASSLAISGKGFTLIELLVVFAIIVSIMSVVFTNQGSFNKTFVLANTAYDVALTMRNAETYGLGSRAFGTTVNAGYGLHFDKDRPDTFIFFGDTSPAIAPSCDTPDCKPGDFAYTQGSDSTVRSYTLGNGITITDFCAYTNKWNCTYARNGYTGQLSTLDIVFARPNPTPYMSENGRYVPAYPVTMACVVLSSPQGVDRYLSVSLAGEISPTAASCPL